MLTSRQTVQVRTMPSPERMALFGRFCPEVFLAESGVVEIAILRAQSSETSDREKLIALLCELAHPFFWVLLRSRILR